MWPYENHDEDEYYKAIDFVELYAVSLGAAFVCSKEEKYTTYTGDKYITSVQEMNIYKFGDEYFWVEDHFTSDCPFLVFSFGDSVETIGSDDAEPFPYNLSEEELKAEVRYSLGIEE